MASGNGSILLYILCVSLFTLWRSSASEKKLLFFRWFMYLMGKKTSEEHLIKAAVTSKALHNDRITPEDNRQ